MFQLSFAFPLLCLGEMMRILLSPFDWLVNRLDSQLLINRLIGSSIAPVTTTNENDSRFNNGDSLVKFLRPTVAESSSAQANSGSINPSILFLESILFIALCFYSKPSVNEHVTPQYHLAFDNTFYPVEYLYNGEVFVTSKLSNEEVFVTSKLTNGTTPLFWACQLCHNTEDSGQLDPTNILDLENEKLMFNERDANPIHQNADSDEVVPDDGPVKSTARPRGSDQPLKYTPTPTPPSRVRRVRFVDELDRHNDGDSTITLDDSADSEIDAISTSEGETVIENENENVHENENDPPPDRPSASEGVDTNKFDIINLEEAGLRRSSRRRTKTDRFGFLDVITNAVRSYRYSDDRSSMDCQCPQTLLLNIARSPFQIMRSLIAQTLLLYFARSNFKMMRSWLPQTLPLYFARSTFTMMRSLLPQTLLPYFARSPFLSDKVFVTLDFG